MNNYNRYYDQQSAQDYDQYNLWQDSRFHNGFHLTHQWGEDSQPSQDLESSDDDQSGGESKESERKAHVRRVVTKGEMFEDPEPYCRMLFEKNAEEEPEEEIHTDPPPQSDSGYDWTQTWKRGDILDPEAQTLNQTTVHENPAGKGSSSLYEAGMSTERNRKPVHIENKVQRRIMKAVSQPITISRATSMMERMGWKGGPLGKNSDGIAEPIAPNATYITKKGFGLEERVQQKRENPKRNPPPNKRAKLTKKEGKAPKKQQSKKLMKKNKIELITTNALIQILEFVRNDREIEIEFDKKLTPLERKIIHNTVQIITHSTQEFNTVDYDNQCHVNLLEKIHECNYYSLTTESEGAKKERHLCLYKEAKDHMYLVTPDDLSCEGEDLNDCTTLVTPGDLSFEEVDLTTTTKIDDSDVIDLTDCPTNIDEDDDDTEVKTTTTKEKTKTGAKVEESAIFTVLPVSSSNVSKNIDDNDVIDLTDCTTQVKAINTKEKVTTTVTKIEKTATYTLLPVSGSNVSKNDAEIDKNDIKMAISDTVDKNQPINENKIKEVEKTKELIKIKSDQEENTNPFLKSIERMQNAFQDDNLNVQMKMDVSEDKPELSANVMKETQEIKSVNANVHNTKVTNSNKKTTSYINNDIKQNTCTNTKVCTKKTEIENVQNVQNKDIHKTNFVSNDEKRKNIAENLIEYFNEFLDEESYTEFRFLGPFDHIETREVNKFLDSIYNCVYSGESSEEYSCILEKINGEDMWYYEVKQDCNGCSVIYKCKTEDT